MKDKRERRKELFKISVKPDTSSDYPDEMEIAYTKNGFQKTIFSLLPEEMEQFILVFQDTLKKIQR
jgi:hypothetical protein